MTFLELSDRIGVLTEEGSAREAYTLSRAYHMRLALPWATPALAMFALAFLPRRAVPVWSLAAVACGACLSYWVLLGAAVTAGRDGTFPGAAAAWLPAIVFTAAAAGRKIVAAAARS